MGRRPARPAEITAPVGEHGRRDPTDPPPAEMTATAPPATLIEPPGPVWHDAEPTAVEPTVAHEPVRGLDGFGTEELAGSGEDRRRRARPASAVTAGSDPSEEATPGIDDGEQRPGRWRALAATAIGLATVAVLLGGLVLGYRISNGSKEEARAGTTVKLPDGRLAATDSVALAMPDVEGLSKADALEALADAGIDPSTVATLEREWVGDPGRIVGQEPTRGTKEPGKVTIFVSKGARMPDLTGRTETEAAKLVADLGGVMQREYVYDPNVPTPRTVINTDPAKGAPMTQTVVARVSVEASSRYLIDVEGSGRSCSTGSVAIAGGTPGDHSLWCSTAAQTGSPQPLTYSLEGRVARLRAEVAIANDQPNDGNGRLEVWVDGKLATSLNVAWGERKPIDVDLRGKSRLDLIFTPIRADDREADGIRLVLKDPTLLGSPSDLAELDR